jgi:hypothetical protein
MGSLECDQMLAPFASFRVASADTAWFPAFRYDQWVAALVSNPKIAADALATQMVDSSFASLAASGSGKDQVSTFSVADLSKVGDVVTAVDALGTALDAKVSADPTSVAALRQRTIQYYSPNEASEPGQLVDLGALCTALQSDAIAGPAARSALAALQAEIIYNRVGAQRTGAGGLSVYFPADALHRNSTIDTAFAATGLAATHWASFVASYLNAVARDTVAPAVHIMVVSALTASPSQPVTITFTVPDQDLLSTSLWIANSTAILTQFDLGVTKPGTYSFSWSGNAIAISDGTASQFVPAFSLPSTPGYYLANALYTPVGGSSIPAFLLLQLPTGQSTGTVVGALVLVQSALASVSLSPGDSFRILWSVFNASKSTFATVVSTTPLTVSAAAPLTVFIPALPTGVYRATIACKDFAGNIGTSSVDLTVP